MLAYHSDAATPADIPPALVHLRTALCAGLSRGDATEWRLRWRWRLRLRFVAAIAPDADLSGVALEFSRWMLDNMPRPNAGADRAAEAAILDTIAVFDNWIATGTVDESARSAALDAASAARAGDRVPRRAAYRALRAALNAAGK